MGDVRNIGAGSVSFGRNGASYAYLTTTVGHDCVTYGAASMAGGRVHVLEILINLTKTQLTDIVLLHMAKYKSSRTY